MSTINNDTPGTLALDTEPDQDETLELSELLKHFTDHAGTLQSFKMLQGLFNDHVATGALEGYTKEALQDLMYHFILISEVIFKLETQAANNRIKEIKAMATRMAG